MNRPVRFRRAALAAVLCLALSACGSRVDGAAIVAEAGGTTVRLSPESIEALGAAALSRPPAAAGPTDVASASSGVEAPVPAPPPDRLLAAAAAPKRSVAKPPTAPTSKISTSPAPAPKEKRCQRSLETIKLGHIGLFSGVAAPLTGSAVTTMAAWVKDVNSRGGLACHPVRVFTKDDGGDPSRSAALAQELVEREGVVAFVGTFTLNPNGIVPVIERLKVPAVGGGGGMPIWYSSPWLFPDGASTDDQIVGFIRSGVERGKKKLGVLYCVEAAACTEAMDKVRRGFAKEAGAELVYDAPISITQPDYTAQCLNAQKAGVDQLTLGMDGASMSRLARSCIAVGYRPLISTISGLLGSAQARDENLRSFGIVTTSAAPLWTQTDQPGLREYHRTLQRWAPNVAPDGASILTFVAAKLFEAVMANVAEQAAAGPVTPELVLTGLGKIRNETLGGLTGPLTFTPGQKRAVSNGCVFYQLLDERGWSAPRGTRPVCVRR